MTHTRQLPLLNAVKHAALCAGTVHLNTQGVDAALSHVCLHVCLKGNELEAAGGVAVGLSFEVSDRIFLLLFAVALGKRL